MTVRPIGRSGRRDARRSPSGTATLQEVFVVTSVPAEQRLAVWRAPAPGGVREGHPARGRRRVAGAGPRRRDGERERRRTRSSSTRTSACRSPELRWAPGSPGTPGCAASRTQLAVELDPVRSGDGDRRVDRGRRRRARRSASGPLTTPSAGRARFPRAAARRHGARDRRHRACSTSSRATLAVARPSSRSRSPASPRRGGSSSTPARSPRSRSTAPPRPAAAPRASGRRLARRARPSPTPCSARPRSGGPSRCRDAAYPALLAEPAFVVSLATTDPELVASATAIVSLTLPLDGSGLVEVSHDGRPDRARRRRGRGASAPACGAGSRSRCRSVRVVDALVGLVPGGPARASSAPSVASVAADGADLVLDALPAAPARRSRSSCRCAARRRAGRLRGGGPLERAAGSSRRRPRAGDGDAPLPGCGCGAGVRRGRARARAARPGARSLDAAALHEPDAAGRGEDALRLVEHAHHAARLEERERVALGQIREPERGPRRSSSRRRARAGAPRGRAARARRARTRGRATARGGRPPGSSACEPRQRRGAQHPLEHEVAHRDPRRRRAPPAASRAGTRRCPRATRRWTRRSRGSVRRRARPASRG